MTFTIHGTLRSTGEQATLIVDPEAPEPFQLSGSDAGARAAVDAAVFGGDRIEQTPTGPEFQAALDPPGLALLTALSVFEWRGGEIERDVPEVPISKIPPGAVAGPKLSEREDKFEPLDFELLKAPPKEPMPPDSQGNAKD